MEDHVIGASVSNHRPLWHAPLTLFLTNINVCWVLFHLLIVVVSVVGFFECCVRFRSIIFLQRKTSIKIIFDTY